MREITVTFTTSVNETISLCLTIHTFTLIKYVNIIVILLKLLSSKVFMYDYQACCNKWFLKP